MKQIFSILSLLLAAQGLFAQEVKITGKITNNNADQSHDSITLQINTSMENPVRLKSAVSKKGAFSFVYTENSTNYCEIFFTPEDKIPLFLSSGETVSVTADASNLNATAVVTGSQQTNLMQKNVRLLQGYMNEAQELKKRYDWQVDSLEKRKNEQIAETIKKNPRMLSNLSIISVLPIDDYHDVYQLVDSALMATYPTNAFVQDFHDQMKKVLLLREGSTISDIVLADVNGKMINLESLRGKIVLVDFWASWCRPCRMEIPNLKKTYEKYHEAGFDIFSVSVDNDYSAWKKALDQEQMPWANVRDDRKIYSNMFNVSSIPFTILIDREGKIIAKGVRGSDLNLAVNRALSK
ncbi:MAG: AhpC/TSA family protein [Bacteroidales bacterium]|nr:AhpC/TSA family protein [Bacteroidales bacterium]